MVDDSRSSAWAECYIAAAAGLAADYRYRHFDTLEIESEMYLKSVCIV